MSSPDQPPATGRETVKSKRPSTGARIPKRVPKEHAIALDEVPDENFERINRDRLYKWINIQAMLILVLTGLLLMGLPFFHPISFYYAHNAATNRDTPLIALGVPNMTNRAVLSWATVSITEIMTMGFGDYLSHLKGQAPRFTDAGWEGFSKDFDKKMIGDRFKKNQLVLTTVPSDTAVITKQGENEHHVYEWHVQMPVVMTYATNNNKTSKDNPVIELTIVRVPTSRNPSGIAIDDWVQVR